DEDEREAVAQAVGDRVEHLAERGATIEESGDEPVEFVEQSADQDEQRRPLAVAVVDPPDERRKGEKPRCRDGVRRVVRRHDARGLELHYDAFAGSASASAASPSAAKESRGGSGARPGSTWRYRFHAKRTRWLSETCDMMATAQQPASN